MVRFPQGKTKRTTRTNDYIVFTAKYLDQWGRICGHCGKQHEEGYWIQEYEYACSDECAIAIMGGKEQFDEAMNEYDDDANYNPICWVEWYN